MSVVAVERRLSSGRLLGYGLGSFGTGVFSTVPAVLLLFYCTQILHISPSLAALAMFMPKLWSVVWDPLVGAWSDRASGPWGKRRPFMLVGAIGVTLSFVALFSWPHGEPAHAVWSVAGIYFVLATSYSLFAVPYVTFPAEASSEARQRERIVGWRIGFAMIGSLIGASLAPALVEQFGGGLDGYAAMSVVVAAICGLGMGAALFAMPVSPAVGNQVHSQGEDARSRRPGAWRVVATAPDFAAALFAYVLQLTAVGALSALTPYWVVFVLGREAAETGVLMAALLGATVLATPAWSSALQRVGAAAAVKLAAMLFAVCACLVPVVTQFEWGCVLYALLGVAFAGLQVGPFALAAHLIHARALRDGQPNEGLMMGIWTAGEKAGLALGPAISGIGLTLVGFASDSTAQTPDALGGLPWLAGAAAALPALVSLVPLSLIETRRG